MNKRRCKESMCEVSVFVTLAGACYYSANAISGIDLWVYLQLNRSSRTI